MNKKFLIYSGIAIAVYLVWQNTLNPNSNSGGVDFGVLDPTNW
jgi:hypothetical protein